MSNQNNTAKPKLLLAFPGMGKSPLCRKNPRYVDADFGLYRTAMHVDKSEEDKLLEPFAQVVMSLPYPYVLSNEPKLMKYAKCSHMYLPTNAAFSARKMGVDLDTVKSWIQGWSRAAKSAGVPVTWISVGLDKYLS